MRGEHPAGQVHVPGALADQIVHVVIDPVPAAGAQAPEVVVCSPVVHVRIVEAYLAVGVQDHLEGVALPGTGISVVSIPVEEHVGQVIGHLVAVEVVAGITQLNIPYRPDPVPGIEPQVTVLMEGDLGILNPVVLKGEGQLDIHPAIAGVGGVPGPGAPVEQELVFGLLDGVQSDGVLRGASIEHAVQDAHVHIPEQGIEGEGPGGLTQELGVLDEHVTAVRGDRIYTIVSTLEHGAVYQYVHRGRVGGGVNLQPGTVSVAFVLGDPELRIHYVQHQVAVVGVDHQAGAAVGHDDLGQVDQNIVGPDVEVHGLSGDVDELAANHVDRAQLFGHCHYTELGLLEGRVLYV